MTVVISRNRLLLNGCVSWPKCFKECCGKERCRGKVWVKECVVALLILFLAVDSEDTKLELVISLKVHELKWWTTRQDFKQTMKGDKTIKCVKRENFLNLIVRRTDNFKQAQEKQSIHKFIYWEAFIDRSSAACEEGSRGGHDTTAPSR